MSTELAVQNQELSTTLFGTDNPAEVVARAAVVATALADLVHRQNLTVRIQSSDYVRVEGWTLLGSMLGVFPVVVWTRPVQGAGDDPAWIGWEARVEARTRGGEVVGAAEAQCLRDEKSWKGRDDFALRSMAQTRAVSKALRLPLGFVMQLAGFNPTPAEEMPVIEGRASAGGNTADAVPADDPAAGTPFAYDIDADVQPAGSEAHLYITRPQQERLFAIATAAGVPTEPDVRDIVREFTGQESTKLIPKGSVYDGIIAAIQAKAA